MTKKIGFLAIEYIPNRKEKIVDGKIMGVHTPLRQDGIYADASLAQDIADAWSEDRLHPLSNVAVVEVVTMDWGRERK